MLDGSRAAFDLNRISRIFGHILEHSPPALMLHIAMETIKIMVQAARDMQHPKVHQMTDMFNGMVLLAQAKMNSQRMANNGPASAMAALPDTGSPTAQLEESITYFKRALAKEPALEEAKRMLAEARAMLSVR